MKAMTINSDTGSSIVRLNIGGAEFCTTVDTLTRREPESMLAAMFSGRHTVCKESDKGYVFVDRDGTHFRHILNWLRDGKVPNLSELDLSELLHEAEYYQLLGLVDRINEGLIGKKEDEELGSHLTRADIITCVRSGKGKLTGLNLSGLDLSKLDLSGVDFRFACLKNVILSRTILKSANFTYANLERANLEEANLMYANFTRANAEGANLEEANLRYAKLTNANLKGANLRRARLNNANLWDTHLEDANLEGVNVDGADLSEVIRFV